MPPELKHDLYYHAQWYKSISCIRKKYLEKYEKVQRNTSSSAQNIAGENNDAQNTVDESHVDQNTVDESNANQNNIDENNAILNDVLPSTVNNNETIHREKIVKNYCTEDSFNDSEAVLD